MGKRIRVTLAATLAFTWMHAAAIGQEAQGKCFLWKVTSRKATVYLLGSIHICDVSMYPLDPTIERAFETSDALALESVEEQVNAITGASKEEEEPALVDTLDNLPQTEERMERIVRAWKAGDADDLNRITRESLVRYPKLKGWFKKLIDDRNVRMARKIQGYLKTEKTYFVVAGSMHLVGKMGIPSLLRKKGCKVEQLNKTGTAAAPAKAG